jgi:hypothetical protein
LKGLGESPVPMDYLERERRVGCAATGDTDAKITAATVRGLTGSKATALSPLNSGHTLVRRRVLH